MKETILGIIGVILWYFVMMVLWGCYMTLYGINIIAEALKKGT